MKIIFPIVTTSKCDEYLEKLQIIVESDFKDLFFIAPFVDGLLIENLLRRFPYNQKSLVIVSRFGDLFKAQKNRIKKAVIALNSHAKKDPTIAKRIIWYVNPKLHAKIVIKDWKTILFGSQNFTYSALKKNFELGAYFENISEKDNEALKKFVDDIINSSTKKLFP